MIRILAFMALCSIPLPGQHTPIAGAAAPRKVPVILILPDDQGWPTLGCYGSKHAHG